MSPRRLAITAALSLTMAGAAMAEEHLVIATGFSYFPAITHAAPGDVVTFINQSGRPEIVVGRDTAWFLVLGDGQEKRLILGEDTELSFFSAYAGLCAVVAEAEPETCALAVDAGWKTDASDAWFGAGAPIEANADGARNLGAHPFGTFDSAPITARISYAEPGRGGLTGGS